MTNALRFAVKKPAVGQVLVGAPAVIAVDFQKMGSPLGKASDVRQSRRTAVVERKRMSDERRPSSRHADS